MNNNRLYYTSLNEIGKLYDFAIFKRRGKSHFYVLVCRQKKLMPKFQQLNCIDIIYRSYMHNTILGMPQLYQNEIEQFSFNLAC